MNERGHEQDHPRPNAITPERVAGVICPICGDAPLVTDDGLYSPYRQSIWVADRLQPGIVWRCTGCEARLFHCNWPDSLPVVLDTAAGRMARRGA